jgi:predicted nucleotidyltransferase
MIDYNNFVHNYQEVIILKAKMTRNEQKRMIKSRLLSVLKGQSRMDNPETRATLGTLDTGQINARVNRSGNQEWTIITNSSDLNHIF